MANEHLRSAIRAAGLTVEEFADIIAVDPKTAQRWISGRTPYARHRVTISRALDRPEHELWPDTIDPPPASTEPDSARPSTGLVTIALEHGTPAPADPAELLGAATAEAFIIDTVGDLLDRPEILAAIHALPAHGCSTRVIFKGAELADPPTLNPSVEMRTFTEWMPLYAIIRADEQLLLRLDLLDDLPRPWLHLQRAAAPDVFDRLVAHCDFLWDNASEFDPADDNAAADDQDDADGPIPTADQTLRPTAPAAEPTDRTSPERPGRRWPGRST